MLIVEDHADSAEFLRLLLEPQGYIVHTAASAQQAREELTAWKPELVLMDLMLPDVEGLDLLHDFRRISPSTQVIVVSGHGSITVAVEAGSALDVGAGVGVGVSRAGRVPVAPAPASSSGRRPRHSGSRVQPQ